MTLSPAVAGKAWGRLGCPRLFRGGSRALGYELSNVLGEEQPGGAVVERDGGQFANLSQAADVPGLNAQRLGSAGRVQKVGKGGGTGGR
jgi:hypothetical protein